MFERLFGQLFRRAERREEAALKRDRRTINGKIRLLARLGEAIIAARASDADVIMPDLRSRIARPAQMHVHVWRGVGVAVGGVGVEPHDLDTAQMLTFDLFAQPQFANDFALRELKDVCGAALHFGERPRRVKSGTSRRIGMLEAQNHTRLDDVRSHFSRGDGIRGDRRDLHDDTPCLVPERQVATLEDNTADGLTWPLEGEFQ